jgi:hypothetical protein
MNKLLTLAASAALISGQLLITGCSSSSDGGGTPVATVPANATVIDDSNAEAIIQSMVLSLSTFEQALNQAFAVGSTPVIGLDATLDIVMPMIKNRSKNSGIDLATGVAINDSGTCEGGGTYSVVGDETDDGTNYSETVTATFTACDIGSGITIDGTLSGTFTENSSTGEYSDSISGTLSVTVVTTSETVKVSFTGLDFQETGNNQFDTYTTTKSTFALVVVVNGTTQAALLAELSAPIVESTGNSCPESGHILITGGNGTTAEGIYNGDDATMTIKANGDVVNPSASCYL